MIEGWFREVAHSAGDHSAGHVALDLSTAAVFGVVIGGVYYFTQNRPRKQVASFIATLVLLTILLAMVTVVIGSNLARAFGLVGALSIVRFRTVVDDTRDTAFVIFAVVTGMAIGSDLIDGAIAALPIVSITAIVLSIWAGKTNGRTAAAATLVVKVAATTPEPETVVSEVLAKHLQNYSLTAVGTAKQGSALELTFRGTLLPTCPAVSLIQELHRTEGVQAVEWKTD